MFASPEELLPEEAPSDDAIAPDGFEIVDSLPPLVEETTVVGNTYRWTKHTEHLTFLGTRAQPTKILVWYDGTLSSGERSGWYAGNIVKPAPSNRWKGLTSNQNHIKNGLNYRVQLIIDGKNQGIEALRLTSSHHSQTPIRSASQRTWVMLRPISST